jgi:ankyrin repeat protein
MKTTSLHKTENLIHLAIKYTPDDIPALLDDGFDINAQDMNGNTIFHIAAMIRPNMVPVLWNDCYNFDWSLKNNSNLTVADICLQILKCENKSKLAEEDVWDKYREIVKEFGVGDVIITSQ